ncbi:hypothetical protein [Neobacillus sp. SuZ13]|uniref:hypothetical protein n=1 Tax=Neobacillus sp. SuZ13 TaxID=3047875 RepID=UPI0024C0A023|nr:hypothetical protein [Neobacillus sp. SuZ13]WHY65331.1 hypothetical protein QNH17_19855 [Neobacillus sp. SuZ13]
MITMNDPVHIQLQSLLVARKKYYQLLHLLFFEPSWSEAWSTQPCSAALYCR